MNTITCERHVQTWYTEQEHDDDDLDAAAYQIDIARAPTKEALNGRIALIEQENDKKALDRLPPNDRLEREHFLRLQNKKYIQDQEWLEELSDFYAGQGGEYELVEN